MSKYTTELRFLCESLSGLDESKGYNSINDIIAASRSKIFNFKYPIFDEEYREELETKIIKHYYTREICAETFGRWQLFLESRLIEIMPYYNKLYDSELLKFDIFEDVHYSRTGNKIGNEKGENSNNRYLTHKGTDTTDSTVTLDGKTTLDGEGSSRTVTDGEGTSSTTENRTKTGTYTNDAELWQKYSDTPQGSVQNVDNDTYLTNATKNTEDRDQTSNETDIATITGTSTDDIIVTVATTDDDVTTVKNTTVTKGTGTNDYTDEDVNEGNHKVDRTEEYEEIIKGKYPGKSYMQLLTEFRETFLNIDKMIIDELSDLFMMVY